jgi:hypothetical protein
MFRLLKGLAIFVALGALSACAGRDFVRPDDGAFTLGTTTYSEVVQRLGEPRSTGAGVVNGQKVKIVHYSYAASGGEAVQQDVIPVRSISYFFVADRLAGHSFVSSFKSDNTDFEEGKIGAIVKNKTTRAEVVQLLGRPSASYIPPLTQPTSNSEIGYRYVAVKRGAGSPKTFRKTLRISFDGADRVSEVEFASYGDK